MICVVIAGIRDESLRLKTSRYLLQFQSAIMLEAPKCRIPYHFSTDELKHSTSKLSLIALAGRASGGLLDTQDPKKAPLRMTSFAGNFFERQSQAYI